MNPDHLMSFMTQMIDLGFCFALDDFGTGYSNIIQVLKLPFSTVKIDKALLDDTENGRTFLAATIRLFKDLGKEIVIEGIESESLLERVVSLGGRLIQGYLYSPPLTEPDYIEFVKNEKSAR
jgi:EAL domain-containing protein (putative c-di-GMP-specific phosphodiesterase class I)